MFSRLLIATLLLGSILSIAQCKPANNLFSGSASKPNESTLWAVLVAGSQDWLAYRQQADVCHAYQLMKQGGLKDENIIVFMYDDIAHHPKNPYPGKIIHRPDGPDVYQGVPKDFTGDAVTANNFYAVLSGNKSALTGVNSGKVVKSGPKDHIFVYYTAFGSAGVLQMPGEGPNVYAKDLMEVLKKKHEARGYRKLLFYVDSSFSGSMFQGLLPETWDIYAVTSSNSTEEGYATYCPFYDQEHDEKVGVCLGDLFSVAWMEDTEKHVRDNYFLAEQYDAVRDRVKGEHYGPQ